MTASAAHPPAANPTVSVILPVYNSAPWIVATLDSLTAQTMTDWEAIVVDDCSPDNVATIVAAWPDSRVRLVRMDANGGPVLARNRGVAEATGRYIAGLDHDDLCRPDRLARQVAYLDAHDDVVLLGTQSDQLIGDDIRPMNYPAVTSPHLIGWLIWIENPLAWSSVMIRGSVAKALNPFSRPEIIYAEDFDLYHRVTAHGAIARIDEALLIYRQHDGGISKRFIDTMQASATRVLTERHRDVLGAASGEIARLLVLHNMAKLPVPDRATLAALGLAIETLQRTFVARHAPTGHDLELIESETAKRWHAICRVSIRQGSLTLGDVAAASPPSLRGATESLWSSAAIGAVRRVRQTFAA